MRGNRLDCGLPSHSRLWPAGKGHSARNQGARGCEVKITTIQVVARLLYADSLCSWLNVHDEMKPAMSGLVRMGLAVRRFRDETFKVTDAGKELISANKKLISGGYQDKDGAYVHKTVKGARYWIDQWRQQIPS